MTRINRINAGNPGLVTCDEGDKYHATRTGLPEGDNYPATRTALPGGTRFFFVTFVTCDRTTGGRQSFTKSRFGPFSTCGKARGTGLARLGRAACGWYFGGKSARNRPSSLGLWPPPKFPLGDGRRVPNLSWGCQGFASSSVSQLKGTVS